MFKYFMKKKYPDWEDNEYNRGVLKFVWGIRSDVHKTDTEASFYTYNNIAIYFDRKAKKYILDVSPSPYHSENWFDVKYLVELLEHFTVFMNSNQYNTNNRFDDFQLEPEVLTEADSVSQLYTMFRIFVEGYKAVYGGDSDA